MTIDEMIRSPLVRVMPMTAEEVQARTKYFGRRNAGQPRRSKPADTRIRDWFRRPLVRIS